MGEEEGVGDAFARVDWWNWLKVDVFAVSLLP